jgi:hypothetical protein
MKARIWYLVLQVSPTGQVHMAAPLSPTRVAKPGVHSCDALSHARSSCYERKVWKQNAQCIATHQSPHTVDTDESASKITLWQ